MPNLPFYLGRPISKSIYETITTNVCWAGFTFL